MIDSKRAMRPEPGSGSGAIAVYPGAERLAFGLFWCVLLTLASVAIAGESGTGIAVSADPAGIEVEPPDMVSPWLDEVRAQREAWEARRSVVREQYEQRRRAHHPRGGVQPPSWEEDLRRRRAERQERIDQDRAVFRRFGPEVWWPPRTFADQESEVSDRSEARSPEPPPVYPPGWDNLWYFRGY